MPDTTSQSLSEAEIDALERDAFASTNQTALTPLCRHWFRKGVSAILAKQRELDAKAEPASDLAQRCREIIKWQDTGILKGKALRTFASKQRWADDVHALTIAERVTAREAFDFIASHPPAAQDREPMTEEQIASAMTGQDPIGISFDALCRIARAIERFHGIKEPQR